MRRCHPPFFIPLPPSTVQVGAFLYSTCKRQARRTLSTPAIRCGRQARAELTTKKRPALFVSSYFDANPRGLKLNCTLWASKTTWTWLQLFSQTAHFSFRSQQAARGRPQIMRDRPHGNWSSSCLELPGPMSRSLWPFRAMCGKSDE